MGPPCIADRCASPPPRTADAVAAGDSTQPTVQPLCLIRGSSMSPPLQATWVCGPACTRHSVRLGVRASRLHLLTARRLSLNTMWQLMTMCGSTQKTRRKKVNKVGWSRPPAPA